MKKLLIAIIVLAVLGGLGYWAYHNSSFLIPNTPAATNSAASSTTSELTQAYSNTAYRFSLKMPADFAESDTQDPDTNATTIVLQNQTGDGVQIVVSPFSDDPQDGSGYTLTKERILQDVPDLAISNEQPVTVGTNYTGLAFKSNNDAFGGDSREVWFVFRGNLYQISTYARLDPLLQKMFGTWSFN